jgi:predicted 3-demethylubiquinone-9 3-methyltransferase (glyoxalase superfamily)
MLTRASAPLIVPCLWFDGLAEEAATFYTSLFDDSRIVRRVTFGDSPAPVTVDFELAGFRAVALNGGPQFRFTPAVSFFVMCPTAGETDRVWQALAEGGRAMMPLGEYPWSRRYGWTADRFGFTWQVMLAEDVQDGPRIVPCQLFVGSVYGRGEEAMNLYTSLFPESSICTIERYGPNEPGREGTVKHARFTLGGRTFTIMDGPGEHAWGFTEAVSFSVNCETQDDIDRYWTALAASGGAESRCGWLKDRFGVSWQVVPSDLPDLLCGPHAAAAAQALLGMGKVDVAALRGAR